MFRGIFTIVDPISDTSREGFWNQQFSYIQFPILVNYILIGNHSKNIRIFAGPSMDFLIPLYITSLDASKRLIFDMISGVGFQIYPLVFELRYDYNLTDAYVSERNNISGKLSTFTILAGILTVF
jgi:hypothetical protein